MTTEAKLSTHLRDRLRAGDSAALEELLALHWPALVDYLGRLLDDRDAAEDVAQEAFVRLWRARERLAEQGSIEAFLFQIARNGARDRRRRLRTRERWARLAGRIPRHPPASDPAEVRELEDAVERAIAALPERRREVFLLLRTSRLTYQEVATLLGIAPQTVANLMSRALDDLRAALAPYL